VITTLVWKEYREHRSIWLAMAVLAVLILGGVAELSGATRPGGFNEGRGVPVIVGAVVLAVAYGLVCGGMMLAGEEEGRTAAFLDGLPVLRFNVWLTKAVVGGFLALAQGLLLAGVVTALGVQPAKDLDPVHWFWVLPGAALEAFAWGLFGSALSRSVLGAIALGVPPFVATWMVGAGVAGGRDIGALLAGVAFAVAGLSLSAAFYTRSDWERTPAGRRNRIAARDTTTTTPAWQVLLWLAARQSPGSILLTVALVFGAGLYLPVVGITFWPLATLLAGVLCGTAVFRGEQTDESYRFLGDQRFPVAVFWAWKNAYWLLIAGGLTALVFLAGTLYFTADGTHRATQHAWEADFFLWRSWESPLVFLGLWLLHGFAVGQLCALFWRKSIVALAMALTLSTAASAVWLPSVLGGGLHLWQAYAVPVLLLATSLLLQRAWVSDRLFSWKPLAGLAFAGLLAVGAVGGGLAYRVAEVPDVGDPFDVVEFIAGLPSPERNEAGNQIRQSLHELQEWETEVTQALRPPEPLAAGGGAAAPGMGGMGGGPMAGAAGPGGPPGGPPLVGDMLAPAGEAVGVVPQWSYEELVDKVLREGWGRDEAELGKWLDHLFLGPWVAHLCGGAAAPLGLVEDPRRLTLVTNLSELQKCTWASKLFAARALQLQAQGGDKAALELFRVVLALSRQLRHNAVPGSRQIGEGVEQLALDSLDRWLDRLGKKPELVREVLADLGEHEAAVPPLTDSVKVLYLAAQNSLRTPPQLISLNGWDDRQAAPEISGTLATISWEMPWEQERSRRLVDAVFAGRLRAAEVDYARLAAAQRGDPQSAAVVPDWLPPLDGGGTELTRSRLAALLQDSWLLSLLPHSQSLFLSNTASLCRVRAARLKFALALYHAEQGKPAAALTDLVPRYLPVLPLDPFSGRAFGYRRSGGEILVWPDARGVPEPVSIPPGRAVLWSVGPDLVDQGGTKQGENTPLDKQKGVDLIYLVPSWPDPAKKPDGP
jgi:hypothetical protein